MGTQLAGLRDVLVILNTRYGTRRYLRVLNNNSTEPPTKNKESKLKTNGEQDLSQNQNGAESICTVFSKQTKQDVHNCSL